MVFSIRIAASLIERERFEQKHEGGKVIDKNLPDRALITRQMLALGILGSARRLTGLQL